MLTYYTSRCNGARRTPGAMVDCNGPLVVLPDTKRLRYQGKARLACEACGRVFDFDGPGVAYEVLTARYRYPLARVQRLAIGRVTSQLDAYNENRRKWRTGELPA